MVEKNEYKEKNNITNALNILYAKKEKICLAYVSKNNSIRVSQVILLMISFGVGREAILHGRERL